MKNPNSVLTDSLVLLEKIFLDFINQTTYNISINRGNHIKITKIFNLYDEYNEKYFGGTLPYCDIIVGKLSDAFGWTIYDKGFCPVIVLDENLNTRYTKITLLHEMIHVWQGIKGYNLDHDETFQGVARNICKSEKFNYKKF